ncbi:MAG TPA: PAS domain S-box protein, partial [Desulfuromonadales bacterium]|nr:PAS domain S-box protein [Desulfuromonadales bacterium]
MSASHNGRKKARLEEDLRIQRQLAFAAGLFQEDLTVHTLLEALAEGVVVIDSSGIILQINTAAERMFGYPKTELIGKPHALLIPERFREIHEGHQARYFEDPKIRRMGELLDLYGRRKDGGEFPVEISLSYIETASGVFVLALVSDITLRKEYESRLQEKEELFRIQVECVKDYAVFMLDARGNVLNWNAGAERLKGYRDEEIIGRHFSCFFSEEDRQAGKPAELLKSATEEGRIEDQGWRLRKDGSRFWADVIMTVLRDEKGNLRGYSKVTHDITEHKQAEEALREAERKLRMIFEHSTNLFYMHTADHVLTYMSPQSRQFFDCEPEAALVRWTDFITDDPINKAAIEATQRAIDTGQRQPTYQVECVGRKGRKIWVEVNEAPVVENGKAVAVVGSLTDITDRKRAEEALRESEQRFVAFMRHLPAAAWMKDLQGRYVFANVEAERVFSVPLAALYGKRDEEVFPPETARQFRENDERVLTSGGSLQTTESLRQADGIEHHSIVSKFAVPGPDGQPAYIAGVAFDITDRRRAEEALHESEERYRTLFESIDEGFCVIEMLFDENEKPADFRFLEVNGAFEAQTGISNAPGRRIREIAPALEEHWFEIYGRVAITGESVRFQHPAEALGRYFDVYAFRVSEPEKHHVAILFNDISERMQREREIARLHTDLAVRARELAEANRELEAFNYTVAHDLRNPLTAINGTCQAIQALCGDMLDEQCKGYLRMAYEGTLRMNRLIEALLQFAHLARVEPKREKVELSSLALEVARELKLSEPQRRVAFRVADGVVVDGDANLLRVVLDNLLGNAWKYTAMREGAVIEFGVIEIDGETACFVRDNGAGFDMKDVEKLFIPFQRLPGAEEFRGFGIGLATVERIVRRHGGR